MESNYLEPHSGTKKSQITANKPIRSGRHLIKQKIKQRDKYDPGDSVRVGKMVVPMKSSRGNAKKLKHTETKNARTMLASLGETAAKKVWRQQSRTSFGFPEEVDRQDIPELADQHFLGPNHPIPTAYAKMEKLRGDTMDIASGYKQKGNRVVDFDEFVKKTSKKAAKLRINQVKKAKPAKKPPSPPPSPFGGKPISAEEMQRLVEKFTKKK